MKGIKKLTVLFLFGIMLTVLIHAPLMDDIDQTGTEVVIKHNVDNQHLIHSHTPDYTVISRTPVFMIAKNDNAATEIIYRFFSGRTRQREGTLFKQRARSTIQSVLYH